MSAYEGIGWEEKRETGESWESQESDGRRKSMVEGGKSGGVD